jgi:sorbitol-6-phosphate 2-dehydrogenase
MDPTLVAPFLRGLALDENKDGPAYVCLSSLDRATPKATIPVDIPANADQTAARRLLREAVAKAGGALGRVFLLRVSGSDARLFAVAEDPDAAKALLAGHPAKPEVKLKTAPRRGGAAGRDKVVDRRIALVTGGAQGFGEEIARGLSASGAFVYVADMNEAGAAALAAELNAKEGRFVAHPLAMDVTDEDSVARAFAEVAATTGGLDLLVSNAGVLRAASVLEQPLADFDFVTRVNYTAFFVVTRQAALMLREQREGAPRHKTDIIQINSKSGLAGSNKNGAYAGSKFGGIGLVQSFALELVEYGVKVNAICPGNFFDGPLWSDPEKGLFVQYLRTGKVPGAKTIADVRAFYEAKVPMGRGCEGPDVMRAIFYLVEQEYETGQALPVTGGQVMLS